jgi:CheY-like chemotaxis protein
MKRKIKDQDTDLERNVPAGRAYGPSSEVRDNGILEKDKTVMPNGHATDQGEKWDVVRYSERKSTDSTRLHVDAQASPRVKTVLLVDDVDGTRITTKWFLSNFGYAIDAVRSAEEALAQFDSKMHDLVITDNRMPGMSGTEMAHIIKLRSPSTPVLMYTGMPPDDQSCVNVVVAKPTHMLILRQAVEKLLSAVRGFAEHGPAGLAAHLTNEL